MLSTPIVVPEAFRTAVTDEQMRAYQQRVHDRAEQDGVSHYEAGVRVFVDAFTRTCS